MREQWKQGIQWGSAALVARWLAPWIVYPFWWATGESDDWRLMRAVNLAAAVPVCALLVVTWSRYSRLVPLAIIAWVAWHVERQPLSEPTTISYAVVRSVAPYCEVVPFLPLLVLTPERPRLTVALALVGRWREAARSLAGWRWVIAAIAVFLLGDAMSEIAPSFGGVVLDGASRTELIVSSDRLLAAFVPVLALFGIAAIPSRRARATA